jgi:hypothetical protein
MDISTQEGHQHPWHHMVGTTCLAHACDTMPGPSPVLLQLAEVLTPVVGCGAAQGMLQMSPDGSPGFHHRTARKKTTDEPFSAAPACLEGTGQPILAAHWPAQMSSSFRIAWRSEGRRKTSSSAGDSNKSRLARLGYAITGAPGHLSSSIASVCEPLCVQGVTYLKPHNPGASCLAAE